MKFPYLFALLTLLALLLIGCGEDDTSATAGVESAMDANEPLGETQPDLDATLAAYYETKVALPPEVREAYERGAITQEEIDERTAAGEFPKFFRFATIEDLPEDLNWEDGMDLADIGSPNAKKGGTQYSTLQDFPRTLRLVGPDSNGGFRPFILDDVSMQWAHRHPNDTTITETGHRYFPGLAKEWAVDKENRTVYVRIDPDARWSDGEPVTVEDAFFMFYFFQSPHIRAPWYNNFYNRNYTNITQYDALTFSMSVPEAKPDMNARVLELRPLPKHFFGDFGSDYVERYQWRFVPTTGAYVINEEDIDKQRSIALTRQKDWWAKDKKFWRNRFNPDRIQFDVIRDPSKAFDAFKKGEIGASGLNLPEYWYEKLPADDPLVQDGYIRRYTFYNDRPRPTFALWINSSRPLLDNRDIRVGLHHATNWDYVIESYLRGDAVRMRTPQDGYDVFTHPRVTARGFDVEKALEAFAKAGFTERGNDGVLRNDEGQRLAFTLSSGYRVYENMLAILKEEALKAGVELNLKIMDGTAGFKLVQEKKHDVHFMAFAVSAEMYPRYWETWHGVNAYDVPYLPDGSPNPDRQPKAQTNNLTSLANPELDALIERYRASDDAQEMIELAHRMTEMIHEEAVFIQGFVRPFYRVGAWRWYHYPEDFNVKLSEGAGEYFVHWIDPEERRAVLQARRRGETFEAVENEVHDQFKPAYLTQN